MDLNAFYGVVAATSFALLGLWWNVVENRPDWMRNEQLRGLMGGVYLSFLIPGAMSLGAQIGGPNPLVWRAVFLVAALLGLFYTFRLMRRTHAIAAGGFVTRNRWIILLLYTIILLLALFPGLGLLLGLTGLQVEAFIVVFLVIIGHGLAWELMTAYPKKISTME